MPSKSALLWVMGYGGAMLGTWLNPIYGLLGVMLEYYQRPSLQWWGDELPDLRYNFMISAAFGLSVLLRRDALPDVREVRNIALPWLLGFTLYVVFVNVAIPADRVRGYEYMTVWLKVGLVMPLLVATVLRSRQSLDWFLMAHVLGGTIWGFNAWMDPERNGARLMNVGSGDSTNDNAAAMHLLTILPLALMYVLTETDKKRRAFGLVASAFVANTIILCNSRGSVLGLACVTLLSIVVARPGQRKRMIGVGTLFVAGFLILADPEFIARQQSTADYEQDSSAMQRLWTWQGAFGLVADHPLGVGGRGFHTLSPKYIPQVVAIHEGEERAPHNTYVMVMCEYGIPGSILWLTYMGSVFAMLLRIRKWTAHDPDNYYFSRSVALVLCLAGPAVAGMFGDRLYSEGIYWLAGAAMAMYRLAATELAGRPEVEAVVGPTPPAGLQLPAPAQVQLPVQRTRA